MSHKEEKDKRKHPQVTICITPAQGSQKKNKKKKKERDKATNKSM